MSHSWGPHGLQHARLLCTTLSPRVCSNPCPLSQWCYLSISSPVALFSFSFQSFPASGSFLMSWLFKSALQSIGVSVLASVLTMNIWGLFPLGMTGLTSLHSKGHKSLLQHHNSEAPILQHPDFFFFFICGGFCHTLKWNSHGFTCVPHPNPPLPPPSPPAPSRFSQCTRSEHLSHASNLGWWSVSP